MFTGPSSLRSCLFSLGPRRQARNWKIFCIAMLTWKDCVKIFSTSEIWNQECVYIERHAVTFLFEKKWLLNIELIIHQTKKSWLMKHMWFVSPSTDTNFTPFWKIEPDLFYNFDLIPLCKTEIDSLVNF